MPYLTPKQISTIEMQTGMKETSLYFASLNENEFPGAINYLNYKIAITRFKEMGKWRKYQHMAVWMGTMLLCMLEVWRRVIVDYEKEKILENGDIEP